MPVKRALGWVLFWVVSAIGFSFLILRFYGSQQQIDFLTCYAVEWSLSLDNLFVFLMIFNSLGVEGHSQLRALNWGIIGAVILRLVFISLGVVLVNLFKPILYFFGALLIFSAYKMVFSEEGKKDITKNKMVQFVRKRFAVTENFEGELFFTRRNGVLMATPMLLVLITIESSDVLFAVDSIPAAFAITLDPFIIFSANIFAILGLRSLYFLLAHADKMFSFLKYGVALVLTFVGFKMLVADFIHIRSLTSLAIVIFTLTGSIIISILLSLKSKAEKH